MKENVVMDSDAIKRALTRMTYEIIERNKGTEDIDAVIGNNSMNDAYSGQAAASVKNQWYGLADTFESFLQNFQNWYDQSVEVSKANQALQSSTSNVQIES